MEIIILGFILPAFVVIMGRYLFAFYYPINLGIFCTRWISRTPYEIDKDTAKTFFIVNSIAFTVSYILLSLLVFLPAVSLLYSFPSLLDFVDILYKALIIFYLFWFFSLLAAGYIFGQAFYQALSNLEAQASFYFINLDLLYNALISIPSRFANSLGLIFDNEKKVESRIKLHQGISKELKKSGEPEKSIYLEEAVRMNKNKIAKMTRIRKRWGTPGVIAQNILENIGSIIFVPFAPAILFYLVIVDFLVGLFNISEVQKSADQPVGKD